jgi:N4-gp56 family major capsid protein
MAFTGTTTTQGTPYWGSKAIKQYFDDVLLEDPKGELVLNEDAVKKSIPRNLSKTIEFTRVKNFSKVAAVSEGESPAAKSLAIFETVTATIAEYADYTELSSLFNDTNFVKMEEIVKAMRQGMIETPEWVLMTELCTGAGSQFLANGAISQAAMTSNDVAVAADIVRMRTILANAKGKPFKDGHFRAVMSPYILESLYNENDSPLIATYQGESGADVRNYRCWKYAQMLLKENVLSGYYVDVDNTQGTPSAGAPGTGVYNLLRVPFYASNSFAAIEIGKKAKSVRSNSMYNEIMICDEADKSDPTNAWVSIGYRFPYVAKILNSSLIYNYVVADPQYATA